MHKKKRRGKNAVTFLFMHEITPDFFQTVLDMLDYKPVKENPGYLV